MSTIYNLEPQPTGSVILHTSQGDLSVELFAKQTPLTCRNFLQLCIDGYYDNTIFHRLVPGFILQGGDPTGTGHGGESIYDGGAYSDELDPWPMDQRHGSNAGEMGVGFRDEFHSRLKFNRRGLLGMANEGKPDTNGSQFFFTLDKTDSLTGKNTLFGRIAGDTIYNLAKMGEAEYDESTDKPLYPVTITSVEILVNPFPDITKRSASRATVQAPRTLVERKKKRKIGKQLLSFGDDEGGDEGVKIVKKTKFDTRIVMDPGDEPQAVKTAKPKEATVKNKPPKDDKQDTVHLDDVTRIEAPKATPKTDDRTSRRPQSDEPPSPPPEPLPPTKTALEKTKDEIAALKASMRRHTDAPHVVEETKKKSAMEQMIPDNVTRGRKRNGGKGPSAAEEQKSLKMLMAFKSKLEQAPPEKEEQALPPEGGNVSDKEAGADEEAELCDLHFIVNCQSCHSWDKIEKEEESDDEGWMSHTLSFKAEKLGRDLNERRKGEDELVVIDPREKARTIQEEKRAQREARAGNSGRAWDQSRNAQLARASAFAGRGAK